MQTLSGTNYPRNGHILIPHCLSTCQPSLACFDLTDCPFDLDEIKSVILNLPRKKAPGIDHITSEMILPLLDIISPILLYLFQLCWQWSYTPQLWRISQTVPIHKKGDPSDPSNYRPISLTSVFRKILEKCIQPELLNTGPTLDVAQGGFRESRGSLDQVLCLTELCQLYHRKHLHYNPVLAFLDIKSAYDTADRNIIWNELSSSIPTPLLALLYNMFEDVSVEVILNNHKSSRFHPKTGVLKGSVSSPYLYSVYINSLPNFLRPAPIVDTDFNDPLIVAPKLNCLLYADDVVLITDADSMQPLLSKCEEHSLSLGYRWNPKKCVIVDPNPYASKILPLQ
ncbi:hypothetical protein G6F71_009360 [Rhizopus microsporus]|nr:hypothetical protein G6F71_009360 [Rhizopus microsporus]